MKQHTRAVAMRLPPEHAVLTIEGLDSLTNITKLTMEAVNVMNEHGHTPSEMVAIIRELRMVLKDLLDSFAASGFDQGRYLDALTKTEDFA